METQIEPQKVLPLTPEESEALLRPFLGQGPVGLAISGGPDSMALAFCAARAKVPCRVFVVDHGLRTESAAEAQNVAAHLAALGLEAEILTWDHEPVASRIEAEARQARYALLLAACRRASLPTLLLAHHQNDQAETILLRLAKGSGVEGLAGMASLRARGGIALGRPFLIVPRARLLATCVAAGVPFVCDPMNEEPAFARARLRAAWDILAREGLTAERLADLGTRAAEAAQAIEFYAQNFLQSAAQLEAGGSVRLALADWNSLPKAVALKALTLILSFLHPTSYAPARKSVLSLYGELAKKDGKSGACTLSGVCLRWGEGRALFFREEEAVRDTLPIEPGQEVLWDGRWRVRLAASAARGDVRALGIQTHETLDRLAPGLRHLVPQGRIRATLPALWRGDELCAIPLLSEKNQELLAAQPLPFPWA